MTSVIVSTALFLLGLAVGSFVNVIALRYRSAEKLLTASVISGRSYCPKCRKTLAWYELIPLVSFLVQRGKCRDCHSSLGWRYPTVELVTGLIFVFIPGRIKSVFYLWYAATQMKLFWPFLLLTAIWLTVFAVLIIIFLIDLKTFLIPNQLNIALGVLGLLAIITQNIYGVFGSVTGSFLGYHALLFSFHNSLWLSHLLGALVGGIFFALIALLSRGRAMGWGDVKLITVLGFLFGWPDVLIIIFLSFVIGALVSLVILIRKQGTLKDMIPFGPFIAVGAAIVFFAGVELLTGYFHLFGIF